MGSLQIGQAPSCFVIISAHSSPKIFIIFRISILLIHKAKGALT